MGAVAAFATRGHATPEAVGDADGGQLALLAALVRESTVMPLHETRVIAGGKYEVAVGWDAEPAVEGQKNAASIHIVRANTSPVQPVEGAEESLKIRIRHRTETREFLLRPVFGQPGYYLAHFVPTRAGNYEFTFVGTVSGDTVEESFDSANGGFGNVEAAADLQFPVLVGASESSARPPREERLDAGTIRLIAAAGCGVGLLGALVALARWRGLSGRRASDPSGAWSELGLEPERQQVQQTDEQPPQRPSKHEQHGARGPIDERGAPAARAPGAAQEFGRSFERELARTLEPTLAEFRNEMAQVLGERLQQSLQPAGART